MKRSLLTIPAMGLLLAGCSIHPLPEDSAGDSTIKIVEKIKCEAHDAMSEIVQKQLRRYNDPVGIEYADRILDRSITLKQALKRSKRARKGSQWKLGKSTSNIFRFFATTAVGFDFKFDMEELNANGFDTQFIDQFTRGTFQLGISGAKDLKRKNIRTFIITSTFHQLYHNVEDADCATVSAQNGNIKYPITGKIGLYEVFDSFIDLHLLAPKVLVLHVREKNVAKGGAFSDTLSFTTTLKANFKPSIQLKPVPRFNLMSAHFNNQNTRRDTHQVTIALVKGERVNSVGQSTQKTTNAAVEALLGNRRTLFQSDVIDLVDKNR